jgi:hypothetical protein
MLAARNWARPWLERSQEFDELHLSRNVDASDFFSAFAENPVPPLEEPGGRAQGWPNMRYLSVTAAALLDGEELQPLLRLVALAAETMPRLEILELWSVVNRRGKDSTCSRQAGVFRYETRAERPKITLITTWGGTIASETHQSWTRVAERHSDRHHLVAETAVMDGAKIQSPLEILNLPILKNRITNRSFSPDDANGSNALVRRRNCQPFLFCRPSSRETSTPASPSNVSISPSASPPPSAMSVNPLMGLAESAPN